MVSGAGVAAALMDYYQVLRVPRTASPAQIVCAFRELARQTHPDLNPKDPPSGERFIRVYAAYEILKNPEERAAYDSRLASQPKTEAWADASAWGATSVGTRRNSEWRRVKESMQVHDGATISVVTRDGNLTLMPGRGKEVKFNGLIYDISTNGQEIKIDNVLGELTVPEGLDVMLQLEIGRGNLVGRVDHGGRILANRTRVNLNAGEIGISLDLNAVDLRVTGYRPGVREFVNQGYRTFTPPSSPHPRRILRIESEGNPVGLRYSSKR